MSVTLYGPADMSAGQFQAAGALKAKGAQSGNMTTSYIGFKGSEDLGGGFSASIRHYFTSGTTTGSSYAVGVRHRF